MATAQAAAKAARNLPNAKKSDERPPELKLESIAAGAERLQMPERTVRWLVASKQLPHYKLKRRIFLRVGDLDEFLAEHFVSGET